MVQGSEHSLLLPKSSVFLPSSLEPLDLPPTQLLSPFGLRDVFLSNLADVEKRLSDLDDKTSHLAADILEEGATFVRDGLEFMEWLKSELGAHMPEFELDFELPGLDDALSGMKSKLPDFPDFDMRSQFQRMSTSLDDARTRLSHLDLSLPSFPDPEEYSEALRTRLSAIRGHLQAISLPSASNITMPSLSPPKVLIDLLPDLLGDAEEEEPPEQQAKTADEVVVALMASQGGKDLITYDQLPHKWKNNEHVLHGYRYAPRCIVDDLLR